jgi:predicted NUDIX family phosphoesterase
LTGGSPSVILYVYLIKTNIKEKLIMMKQENTKIVGKNGIEIIVPLTDKNRAYELVERAKDFMDETNRKIERMESSEKSTMFYPDKNDEMILVFDKEVFETIGMIEDMLEVDVLAPLTKDDYEYMINLLNDMWDAGGSVKRRGDVEEDMSYLQPIPAMVLKRGNEYFAYTRLEGGGEERLHNMGSLTIGGHMNLEQEEYWNFEHLLALGAARELEEEVYILDENGKEIDNHFEITKGMTIAGLGYTDVSSVDAVHLAVYSIITIPEGYDVKVKETDVLKGEFKTLEED